MGTVRRAVITGGSAGIGYAVAEALLRRGHRVFIVGRETERLAEAVHALTPLVTGGGALGATPGDVRRFDSCIKIMEEANQHLERIDLLVNSAGIGFVRSIDDISPDAWQDILDTNLTGVFNCCKAALPYLRQSGGGDIVNLGSRAGRYAFQGGVGYNTTKFGLQGFTEALFLDLHEDNIRVSLVAPATVATGFGGTAPRDWHIQPEDVGRVVADMVEAEARVCINWVEMRLVHPKG